jgi:membrane protease YdiL (CAAX protease family)
MKPTTFPHSLIELLRASATARSAAYLGSMVGVLLASGKYPYDLDNPFERNVHPIAFPGVIGLTNLFTWLRPEDRAGWDRPPTRDELADFARGMALGAAACASMLGVAAAKGWVSAPAWGWGEGRTPWAVLASVALLTAQEGTIVYDEEMVFRGYGLDTLRAALGLPGALALSIALFARYHGPGANRFLGLSAAGLLLALLRLRTGNLWLVSGFHLAWNVTQKSIFGPPDGAPSLRPLHIHGPAEWVGRPGYPEPGWLQILWTLGLAAVASVSLWHARPRADP